jgi:hypothetical protein
VRHTAYRDQTQEAWPTGKLRGHPSAALVPSMTVVEAAALQADIAARGVQVPIEITAAGVVLDGRQRHRAALALNLESFEGEGLRQKLGKTPLERSR